MATPIDVLLDEHRLIERALVALAGLSARLERGEAVDGDAFERLFDFLISFADQRHHNKEEQCLFPALGLLGVPRDTGPVGVMLQEHCTGRAMVAHMKRAAAAHLRGDGNGARLFAEAAQGYIALLTDHIRKEDTVLFRIAQSLFDERSLRALQDDFDATERDRADAYARYASEVEEMEHAWAL